MADLTSVELLRRYIDEPTEVNFSNDLLAQLLGGNGNDVKAAASETWLMKASTIKSQMDELIESMSIGGDSYSYVKLNDRYQYCLAMADRYKSSSIVAKKESVSGATQIRKARNPDWMW